VILSSDAQTPPEDIRSNIYISLNISWCHNIIFIISVLDIISSQVIIFFSWWHICNMLWYQYVQTPLEDIIIDITFFDTIWPHDHFQYNIQTIWEWHNICWYDILIQLKIQIIILMEPKRKNYYTHPTVRSSLAFATFNPSSSALIF